MSEISEQAEGRLDNLENIEPLLGSLRVLSLSTMQMALNRKEHLLAYKNEYYRILFQVISTLSKKERTTVLPSKADSSQAVLVILGSERGICGPYNKNLITMAQSWQAQQSKTYQILSFGTRLESLLKQSFLETDFKGSISKGSFPQYQKAHALINGWLADLKAGKLSSVEVLSFRKPPNAFYKPIISKLLPISEGLESLPGFEPEWPPPIVEGDPLPIIRQTLEHLAAIKFYELILESITAENAIRYNLLEEAKENTRALIETLTIEIQIQKRQAITQQILEMASSAGLTA
mgnify:CR=1 FL=1